MSPTIRKPSSKSGKSIPVRKASPKYAFDLEDSMLDVEDDVEMPPKEMHHLSLYRRLAIGFVVVVAIVLGVVMYMSTVKATITVHAKGETAKAEFLMDVVKTPTKESEVRGRILSKAVGKTQTFKVTAEGAKEVEGVARGEVVIYNKTGNSQTLVKTTRLLTADGKLFRIDTTVNVPARGSVSVPAYADQSGKTGDIATAVSFTIPGLPESLRKDIYAESKTAFSGGLASVSVVTADEIDRSAASLKAGLEEEAKVAMRTEAGTAFAGESFSTSVVEDTRSVVPGATVGEYAVTMSIKVTGVFFDRAAVEEVAVRKLYDQLVPGKEFKSVNNAGLTATVEKVDVEGEMANVRVYLDGVMVPSLNNSALDPGAFAGKSEEEVRGMIAKSGLAESVDLQFFPPWIHTVPRLKDHIEVKVD